MQTTPRIEDLRQKFHENPRRYFAPLANEYRKAGDPEQAIAICRAHLAQQPAHMSGHVVYGQALYDAHRIDEAREVFQLALALDPENIIVLRHLGDIARQRGDVAEARSWYSRALDGDPHDAEIAAYLAELTEPLVSHGVESAPPALVAAPAEEVPTASEDTLRDLDESPYLETAQQAAAAFAETPTEAASQPAEPASRTTPAGERQSRLTPTGEGFPILTRTLAELYLQQGHIEAALDIYRQLAEHEPDDEDIRARIAALSRDAHVAAEAEPDEPAPEHVLSGAAVEERVVDEELQEAADLTGGDDLEIAGITDGADDLSETTADDDLLATTPDDELADATVDEALATTTPDDELAGIAIDEALAASTLDDQPVEATLGNEPAAITPESDLSLNDISWPEFGTEDVMGDSFESVERAATQPDTSDKLWDTADFLGGGFFEDTEAEDEIFGLADDVFSVAGQPDLPLPVPAPEPIASVPESEAEEVTTAAQAEEMAAEGDPSELVSNLESESEFEPVGAPVEFMSANLAGVAYFENPETLPVKAVPTALTVREFFATLGSIRPAIATDTGYEPSYVGGDPAETAQSAADAAVADEAYPLAADAFVNLFADSPVNAEDSRAATALSSAVAHGAPFSTPSTPSGSRRPTPSPPREIAAQPGQESEEDIRRFREWLDGLADS
ncbi:MAG: tetratricopeptide repeat protein [Gemmatimonadales bacterium]